jgi:hypothetical protein
MGIEEGRNHLYVYAQNNPLAFIDPSGLWCYTVLNMPLYAIWSRDQFNWNDWGKWKLFNTYTEGGEFPIFWLNARCICSREKTGQKRTRTEMLWLKIEHCLDWCRENEFKYSFNWEEISDTGWKDAQKTEFKQVDAGSFMNESAAEFACEKKCQNLNR